MAAPPGWALPVGTDPNDEDAVRLWVHSVRAPFGRYANRMIAAGYDSLHALDFTVDDLLECCAGDTAQEPTMKKGHAQQIVAAAAAIKRVLGHEHGAAAEDGAVHVHAAPREKVSITVATRPRPGTC